MARTTVFELLPGVFARCETDWPEAAARVAELPQPRGAGRDAEPCVEVRAWPDASVPFDPRVGHEPFAAWRPIGPDRADLSMNGVTGRLAWSGERFERARLEAAVHPDALAWTLGPLLRLLAGAAAPARGALLVHASAVVLDGRAALFLGASTAGKTTTARRLGREGATRIADDSVIALLDGAGAAPRVRPFLADRAARLGGRMDAWWPVARAYAVHKAAPATRVAGREPGPLDAWCSSLMTPAVTPAIAALAVDAAVALAGGLRPRGLEVRPTGPVLPVVRADMTA